MTTHNKFQRIKITQSIFAEYSKMELEINNKRELESPYMFAY